jgi:transposase-like protein
MKDSGIERTPTEQWQAVDQHGAELDILLQERRERLEASPVVPGLSRQSLRPSSHQTPSPHSPSKQRR